MRLIQRQWQSVNSLASMSSRRMVVKSLTKRLKNAINRSPRCLIIPNRSPMPVMSSNFNAKRHLDLRLFTNLK